MNQNYSKQDFEYVAEELLSVVNRPRLSEDEKQAVNHFRVKQTATVLYEMYTVSENKEKIKE